MFDFWDLNLSNTHHGRQYQWTSSKANVSPQSQFGGVPSCRKKKLILFWTFEPQRTTNRHKESQKSRMLTCRATWTHTTVPSVTHFFYWIKWFSMATITIWKYSRTIIRTITIQFSQITYTPTKFIFNSNYTLWSHLNKFQFAK